MPTENRRVATYLPKELDDCLKAFIVERNLKGDSPALIVILSEYFQVDTLVAQRVDYSGFVKTEQFQELAAKVSELTERVEKGDSVSGLPDKIRQIAERLDRVETARVQSLPSRVETLSIGELAKRLNIDASTLSHWKSSGSKKGKSPDELLQATRAKDPDGIGWILLPEGKRFKPERKLPSSLPSESQGELLPFNAVELDQVSPVSPLGSERSEEG